MYYEINVHQNGQHLFATHERSVSTETKLRALLTLFKAKFPQKAGFVITVTRVVTIMDEIDVDHILHAKHLKYQQPTKE
jgi:hypothetical protein